MNADSFRLFRPLLSIAWALAMAGILMGPKLLPLADPGDFLIRNTIRISLVYLFIAAILILERRPDARFVWTLAWAAYVIHVGMAFEHYHHWRHASAIAHVEQVSGFGPGVFVSYMFTALWTIDVVWWNWVRRSARRRIAWHAIMAFMVFNGAIVYETGAVRGWTIAAFGVIATWMLARWIIPASSISS
jgi:glucan phosphoethanolaminetransferase (alkaline phosphatase superfamily)